MSNQENDEDITAIVGIYHLICMYMYICCYVHVDFHKKKRERERNTELFMPALPV